METEQTRLRYDCLHIVSFRRSDTLSCEVPSAERVQTASSSQFYMILGCLYYHCKTL
jgi:hypothetical protein